MKTTFNDVTGLFTTSSAKDGMLQYGLSGLSSETITRLALHGLKQKIGDAAAIPRDTTTGKSATEAEKLEAMRKVWERLQAGEWALRTGEGSSGQDGLLVRALVKLYPDMSLEEVRAKVKAMDKAKQAKLRLSSRVAPIIEELKAMDAKATPAQDESELFSDFE